MIKINGTLIKTPTSYTPGILDIDKAERNANGEMIIENIAKKRKLELTWSFLTKDEMNLIQTLLKGASRFVTVEYIDLDGTIKTGTFYSGDLMPSALDYKNGIIRWKDLKVSLVER